MKKRSSACTTALAVPALLAGAAVAGPNCQLTRMTMAGQDYCGPEAMPRVAAAIPDEYFGPFRGPCARHDACYYHRALDVIRRTEVERQMSIGQLTYTDRLRLSSAIRDAQQGCDGAFAQDLAQACHGLSGGERGRCQAAAAAYRTAVQQLGAAAFRRALDQALICR